MNKTIPKVLVNKTLVFIALFFTFEMSYSQAYVPFPTENARWVAYQVFSESFSRNYEIFTDGSQVINGIGYTVLTERELVQRYNSSNEPVGSPIFNKRAYGYFRNDTVNHKVFLIRNGSTVESIWYDFSLQVGDTVNSIFDSSSINGITLFVERIDSVLINGNYRKKLIIGGSCSEYIEGIGSTTGLGGYGVCIFEGDESLICAQDDSTVVYGPANSPCKRITSVNEKYLSGNIVEVFPNPAVDNLNFNFSSGLNESKEVIFWNYSGVEVLRVNMTTEPNQLVDVSQLANGFYIYQIRSKSNNQRIIGSFVKS